MLYASSSAARDGRAYEAGSSTLEIAMRLIVQREPFSDVSTKGLMYIDGAYFCYTLERPEAGDGPKAIPAGTYAIEMRFSPHFQRVLPHLKDVPGRSDILIHSGDEAGDSLGCILVGYGEGGLDVITDSRSALSDLLSRIEAAAGVVLITLIDP